MLSSSLDLYLHNFDIALWAFNFDFWFVFGVVLGPQHSTRLLRTSSFNSTSPSAARPTVRIPVRTVRSTSSGSAALYTYESSVWDTTITLLLGYDYCCCCCFSPAPCGSPLRPGGVPNCGPEFWVDDVETSHRTKNTSAFYCASTMV